MVNVRPPDNIRIILWHVCILLIDVQSSVNQCPCVAQVAHSGRRAGLAYIRELEKLCMGFVTNCKADLPSSSQRFSSRHLYPHLLFSTATRGRLSLLLQSGPAPPPPLLTHPVLRCTPRSEPLSTNHVLPNRSAQCPSLRTRFVTSDSKIDNTTLRAPHEQTLPPAPKNVHDPPLGCAPPPPPTPSPISNSRYAASA